MKKAKYLIVGNSVAGVSAAEAIRAYDDKGDMIIVSSENRLAYSKPLIADYLSGKADDERISYREKSFYEKINAELLLEKTAERVDTSSKKVLFKDGDEIAFDKLLIAVGGKPFVPPIKGLSMDMEGVYTFGSITEAEKVKSRVGDMDKVVVLGGGFIGLEVAEALNELGKKVIVVELADRILVRALDRVGSELVASKLRDIGIEIKTQNTVEEVIGDGKVEKVKLKSGEVIEVSALIIAIGVVPNDTIAVDSGISAQRGIDVSETMETSTKDIFAAGDCVKSVDLIDGNKKPLPLWPLAYEQGVIAGLNMAGKKAVYKGGIPMNSLKFTGFPVLSAGITVAQSSEDEEISAIYGDDFYKKMVIRGNRLVGFIITGNPDGAGIYTGLIKRKTDVSKFKNRLVEPDFGLADLEREERDFILPGRKLPLEDRNA